MTRKRLATVYAFPKRKGAFRIRLASAALRRPLKPGVYALSIRVGKTRAKLGAPTVLLDAAGRPRSPATLPGYHAGRSPRNKGQRYPADSPTVAEIVAVMHHAGTDVYGPRLRAHRRAVARRAAHPRSSRAQRIGPR